MRTTFRDRFFRKPQIMALLQKSNFQSNAVYCFSQTKFLNNFDNFSILENLEEKKINFEKFDPND